MLRMVSKNYNALYLVESAKTLTFPNSSLSLFIRTEGAHVIILKSGGVVVRLFT